MSHHRTTTTRWAVVCWILAGLSCAFGVYCAVFDPFYQGAMAAQGLGSLFSWLWAFAGLSVGLVLVLVGLLLTRRFLAVLGIINLGVLIAAGASIGTRYGEFPEFIWNERWAGILALLVISALLTAVMMRLWRRRGVPPKQEASNQHRAS